MTVTPTTSVPATSVVRHVRLSHHVIGSLTCSILFGVFVFCVVVFAGSLGPNIMSNLLEWWGLVCGIYIVTQLYPLTHYDPLEERREKADLLSSAFVAGITFLAIPVWYVARGAWPNWWASKIWINTIPISIADLLIMFILYKISRATVRTTTV